MRLGIFLLDMKTGGAERVVSYLLHYFRELDIEVHLILMNPGIEFELPNNLSIHYISKSDINESGFLKLIKIPILAYKFSKLTKELKLTHSFSLLSRPNYINIISKHIFKSKYKLIISERAYPSLQYGYNNLTSFLNRYLISILYKKADLILCNSNGNANDLISNFGVKRKLIKVIHNPIDINKIQNIQPITNFYDQEYFNIITLGRLDVGKNIELLINAVCYFKNVRLYIIGEGSQRIILEDIIVQKGLKNKVFLLGYHSNPFKYMKGADLFIFGSNHEGFPNSILEAMTCNLPILTTNCKSGPDEILELNDPKVDDIMITEYGILVPINNLDLMIKGIDYFINYPNYFSKCKSMVENRVRQFDTKEILKKYKEYLFQ